VPHALPRRTPALTIVYPALAPDDSGHTLITPHGLEANGPGIGTPPSP
jgi:hypothetical protein